MGIPQKGSRQVTFDGKTFRFLVREESTPPHREQDKSILVTVQEDVDKPGRVLQAKFPYGTEVSSRVVQMAIKKAYEAGWNPAERGAAFQMGISYNEFQKFREFILGLDGA